ncbi:MAG: hypothetical protein WBV41_02195, partial [Terriglobales bacterium]
PISTTAFDAKQSGSRKKNQNDMTMRQNESPFELEEKLVKDSEENAKDDAQERAEGHAEEKMSAVIALRLFRPPLGVSVTVREAKPVRMRCMEREDIADEIVWTAGPWRSSGDWSEQEGWSREEWDIAVPDKTGLALYRLVQDKLSGNWFLEGMYD